MESGAFENHLLGDGPSPLPPRYLTIIESQRWTSIISPKLIRQWTEKGGVLLQGVNIIGVDGRPLVTLSFETQSEAEAAQKAMLPVVRVAKLITPHVIS